MDGPILRTVKLRVILKSIDILLLNKFKTKKVKTLDLLNNVMLSRFFDNAKIW